MKRKQEATALQGGVQFTEDQAIDRLSDMMVELASLEMKRDELNKRIRAKRKEINALAGVLNIDV